MIRVELPAHLQKLAGTGREVIVEVEGTPTIRLVLDAVEAKYPVLGGTIRDHATRQRRAFLRFFACELDLSHEPQDTPLPDAVVRGVEPFMIVGAIAGGEAGTMADDIHQPSAVSRSPAAPSRRSVRPGAGSTAAPAGRSSS